MSESKGGPLTLAVDTSGRVASLALLTPDGRRSLVRLDPAGRRNAKTLIPEAVALCEAAGVTLADVGLVSVTTGPGSFTGLRVGVTFAKTLAFAAGADAVGVPTHAAARRLVRGDLNPGAVLFVVTDGLRGGLYVTRFVGGPPGELPEAGPVRLIAADRFEPDGPVLCGDAAVRAALPSGSLAPAAEAEVDAGNVLDVGLKMWRAGRTDDPFRLVPLYVRRSSAEEKADAP